MILFYLYVGRPPWPTLPGHDAVRLAAEEGDRPNLPRDLDFRAVNLMKDCWHDEPSPRPSFQKILEFLKTYAEEVLHSDADNLTTVTPEPGADGCSCVIL